MTTDLALLLLRVAGALLAVNHGWGKVANLATGEGERFVGGVAELGFPLPIVFAWAAALSELLGGALVALGLFARPAAFFAASTMFVAAFMRHHAHRHLLAWSGVAPAAEEQLKSWGNPESAIVYMLPFFAILLMGPGRFALDALIAGKRGKGARGSKGGK